jgi:hypothetical protein
VLLAAWSIPARAHGPAPAALAVLDWEGDDARTLRLNVGLARRRPDGRFRFLCPALWGDERGAPAATLADGNIVVAASSGLFLLDDEGALRPHPDPNARGASIDLVRGGAELFALRVAGGSSEVAVIEAHSVRTLWSSAETFFSVAADAQQLLLLRTTDLDLDWLVLDGAGIEQEAGQTALPAPVEYVFARLSGGVPYALVLELGRPELGTFGDPGWVSIAKAASSIAGPLTVDGAELLGVDGQLSRLDDAGLSPLAEGPYASCLEETDGVAYACTREGLVALGADGTGEPLFALSQLAPPDLSALADEAQREACDFQWQDLRFDLLALGVELPVDAEPGVDAGEPELEDAEADGQAPDAGLARARSGSGGCSTRAGGQGAGSALLLLAALAWNRRRRG